MRRADDRSLSTGRLVGLGVMAAWGLACVFDRLSEPPTVLHLTVILFHEAGHVVFAPFGEFLGVAGGTLGQLLMPLACAVAFARRGDRFACGIALAWMSMSLIDAAVYAWDAYQPVLPLIGGGTGEDSFHDFIYLFDRVGQLRRARGWAMAMKALGALGLFVSLAWAATDLRAGADRRSAFGDDAATARR